ncbi:sulfite exporter TauE/SafE family protein [uncultured Tyzzerella sp.]|uniref:sulfite exporter TauE/SafE family protein n=1 Tax=uncultured Tyzzerella sp. TaxID=2321398 RepID=UPI002942C582|nr:sulfite exporter TauE/SafE family protein [uncultured Tyzzerella sp.]
MGLILFFVCLIACIVGAISGIGGGIIIKPVVDSLNIMGIPTLSFLSGCTVLSMAIVSLFRSRKQNVKLNITIPIYLGIGASIGGIIGKQIFDIISKNFNNDAVGLVQSILLFIINILILVYMFISHKLKSKNIKSKVITIILGCLLGIISSFLGIGGGPINIVVIYYFYSLDAKQTALSSLIVVFFSQLASLILTFCIGIPSFKYINLIFMCLGGILGALIGSIISKKMDNNKTQKFFIFVLVFLVVINIYNIIKFL